MKIPCGQGKMQGIELTEQIPDFTGDLQVN